VNNRISKSKFVAGCQCLKRLYLQAHESELAAEPDAAAEAIIEQGPASAIKLRSKPEPLTWDWDGKGQ
jgi:hypothetical protein